jgi:hypothetical protein
MDNLSANIELTPEQEAELANAAAESADSMTPDQARSAVKSLGTRLVDIIKSSVSQFGAPGAPTPVVEDAAPADTRKKKRDADGNETDEYEDEDGQGAGEEGAVTPDSLDDSVTDLATDEASDALDLGNEEGEGAAAKKISKGAAAGEAAGEEFADGAPVAYDATELCMAMYQTLQEVQGQLAESNVAISKSMAREDAKDAAIMALTEQVTKLGGNVEIIGNGVADIVTGVREVQEISKAIQLDRDTAPVGAPSVISKSAGGQSEGDESEPAGSLHNNLDGIAQRVEAGDVVEIAKSAAPGENAPLVRFGITENEFRKDLAVALHNDVLLDKYSLGREIFPVSIKKSFGDLPDNQVKMVAEHLGKLPS